jgi:hypothetical protein
MTLARLVVGRSLVAAILCAATLAAGEAAAQEAFIPSGADAAPGAPARPAAAIDPLGPTTPGYFEPVYRSLLQAPLPGRIFAQGGIPAQIPKFASYWNPLGRVGSYLTGEAVVTATHPFFQPLGTNGRSCATCHQPPSGMSISLRNVRARFRATQGKDPLFAPVDGANCPNALPAGDTAPAIAGGRTGQGGGSLAAAHSVLLKKAAIRMPLPWPPRDARGRPKAVEFAIDIKPADDRPGCNTDPVYGLASGFVSVYRRPPSAAQVNFKTVRSSGRGKILAGSLMWDGREPSLEQQAIDATRGHAQAVQDPTADQIRRIVAFQTGIFAAQQFDRRIGRLDRGGAAGGPVNLSSQLPFPAPGFTFLEYDNWAAKTGRRASIARGQAIFNSRIFFVSNVDGFNDRPGVGSDEATCSSCHAVFAAGADSLPNPQMNIGVGGTAPLFGGLPASPDLPRFTLTCHADAQPGSAGRGPIVTNDPGLALVTGKCADIGKFTIPQLRALAAREPYFHDGSAGTLAEVVSFYDKRFEIGFSTQEMRDLVNFLSAL